MKSGWIIILVGLLMACSSGKKPQFTVEDNQIVIERNEEKYIFDTEFTVIFSDKDPQLAMRPAGVENVHYNVATWQAHEGKKADLKETKVDGSKAGDGFDDSILKGGASKRSPNPYNSGQVSRVKASFIQMKGDILVLEFDSTELFKLTAQILNGEYGHPKIVYQLTPLQEGWFSVGYTGAPALALDKVSELWQPLIWQEKRFPELPVMTLAFRSPLPLTMVNDGKNTLGVMASPQEFPFNPLPTLKNSRFGTMVRSQSGQVQSQLFAPVIGGIESHRQAGEIFEFSCYLITEMGPVYEVYEHLARTYFGFKDYRRNEISSLNKTLDNMVDYAKSDYAWFIDSLKGFAYSTDVPGAVKNVSSLNPLELAIVMDDSVMFEERAYPVLEYMLSREKFLFSLDPEQKIQHPSRKLRGPIAPISELTSLYNVFEQSNRFLLNLAEGEFSKTRIRNLDVQESGKNWINAMHLYAATNNEEYLNQARKGADQYLIERSELAQDDFNDPFAGGFFFWPAFVPRWIELFQLYEYTQENRYLEAARIGARRYTMFTWMSPSIPDTEVLVNKDGVAPIYWYLKAKGHNRMYAPEESVEAWKLSEIGLTPESSGTSTGHRAIMMANFAPWMLRIGHHANDPFLKEVAKAAVIGRYRNFPGYHINTERTTIYEKEDYPLREHKDLSVNSFHYNHILPMASMILDYIVTDAFVRSNEEIDFPAEYIEGYAYLQNKFYGHQPGQFYGEDGVQLWMPNGLLQTDHVELNYISGYKDDRLFLAFMNQSNEKVQSAVHLNSDLVRLDNSRLHFLHGKSKHSKIDDQSFTVEVAPNGIVALVIEGVDIRLQFQHRILAGGRSSTNDFLEADFGNSKAMLIHLGDIGSRVYIYLQDDDSIFSNVSLVYENAYGESVIVNNQNYPFEFTVPLKGEQTGLRFYLEGETLEGIKHKSEWMTLGEL
jgi:hypothetical protein